MVCDVTLCVYYYTNEQRRTCFCGFQQLRRTVHFKDFIRSIDYHRAASSKDKFPSNSCQGDSIWCSKYGPLKKHYHSTQKPSPSEQLPKHYWLIRHHSALSMSRRSSTKTPRNLRGAANCKSNRCRLESQQIYVRYKGKWSYCLCLFEGIQQ